MIENEVENCKQFIVGNKSKCPIKIGHLRAGMQGFEPRLMDPESTVLPLDDIPKNSGIYWLNQKNQRNFEVSKT